MSDVKPDPTKQPPPDPTKEAAAAASSSDSPPKLVSVSSLDANLLPTFYAILRTVEKENSEAGDAVQKNKDSLEAAAKIGELVRRIERLRSGVHNLRGVSESPREQQRQLTQLRRQLQLKRSLLNKYASLDCKQGLGNGLKGAATAAGSSNTNGNSDSA